jgi:uncharacterized protein
MSAAPPKKPHPTQPAPPLVVSPRWILTAFVAVVLIGLACAYATLCGLFYYGQWQLVLHPSRDVKQTPAAFGLAFTEVHFGTDATGQPQLNGWWIPAQSPSDPTVLFLHDATGSISDALPDAQLLHNARLNVLLFDYRGFGRSGGAHPTQSLMEADTRSAFNYLTQTRGLNPASILVYARGLGAPLAALLCAEHSAIPALILRDPDGDLATRVLTGDSRTRLVPAGLLFNQNFPLADALHTLHTPKLLISSGTGATPLALQRAADPKITAEIPPSNPTALDQTLRRFLDSYITRPPAELMPNTP